MARLTGDEPETVVVEGVPTSTGFTAAARQIDLTTREGRRLLRKPEDWQKDALTFKRSIGIIDRGSRFHGSAMSRLRFYPGVIVDPDEEPIPVEDAVDDPEIKFPESLATAATVEWERVTNVMGGQASLQRKWGVLLSVIGDSWLVASANEDDPEIEDWDVYAPSALSVKGSGESVQVLLQETPNGPKRTLVDPVAYRIWRQDEEWPGLADSPLRSVFGECEEYLIYARQFRAIGKSRIPAGITLIPSEIDPPKQAAPNADGTPNTDQQGKAPEPTELERMLMKHFLTPISDEGSAASVFGAIVRGKAEFLKEIRHIAFERPMDREIIARLDHLMRRMCDGIDLPPDLLLGIADANHWTGWLIDDATYKAHVYPLAMIPTSGLTTAFLRPAIRTHTEVSETDRRLWLPKTVLGIDPTALVSRPNRGADTNDGFDRGALSWAAWRKHRGFPDSDAPEDEELDKRARYGFAKPRNPAAAETTIDGGTTGGDPTPARATSPVAPLSVIPGLRASSRTPARFGSSLFRIEQRVRERLVTEASSAVESALRRAGNKLRAAVQSDPALRASVNGIEPEAVGAALGLAAASGVVNPDDLLAGSFDGLHEKWESWVGGAQAEIARMGRGYAGADPTGQAFVDDYETAAGADRDRGWAVLAGALFALARTRLFADEQKPIQGEYDPTLAVQVGVIRDALTATGGIEGDAPSTSGMAGGLTGGTEVGRLLTGIGLLVDGWVWAVGAPTFPFEPHADLDGFAFTDWQDEALANVDSWPAFSFYFPGDHFGCQCDTVPVIIAVDEASDVTSSPEAESEVA